jgi:hypothetical protein
MFNTRFPLLSVRTIEYVIAAGVSVVIQHLFLLKGMINLNYQWVCEFTFPTLFDWLHSEISHGKEAEQCLHMDMPLL